MQEHYVKETDKAIFYQWVWTSFLFFKCSFPAVTQNFIIATQQEGWQDTVIKDD